MLLSKDILDSPVCVFLGAGASQPLGMPTMQPFVQQLPGRLRGGSSRPVLAHLVKECGEDLEKILAELDSITSLKSSTDVYAVFNGSQQNIAKVAASLRYEIEYEIIQRYSDVKRQLVNDLYKPLFEFLFSLVNPAKHCLPIFTTNYDTAIEDFCEANASDYEIVDGFLNRGREFVWSAGKFHNFSRPSGKRCIVLFKLHGSVDWVFVRAKNAIVRTPPFHQAIDANRYQNALIYPVVHKVATDEPYFTAYDYYGRCCERARELLTIGYSFRDYDALARLRSAMSFNSDLHLTLWDPVASAIRDNLPVDKGRITTLDSLFGDLDALLATKASLFATTEPTRSAS